MAQDRKEPIQIVCPRCRHTEIIYLPSEGFIDDFPRCSQCDSTMVIEELLDEGKSY